MLKLFFLPILFNFYHTDLCFATQITIFIKSYAFAGKLLCFNIQVKMQEIACLEENILFISRFRRNLQIRVIFFDRPCANPPKTNKFRENTLISNYAVSPIEKYTLKK